MIKKNALRTVQVTFQFFWYLCIVVSQNSPNNIDATGIF